MKKRSTMLSKIWHFVVFVLILISGILLYRWLKRRNLDRKLTDEDLGERCINANVEFSELTTFSRGYFSNNDLSKWETRYQDLYRILSNRVNRPFLLPKEKIAEIELFQCRFATGEQIRSDYNKSFLSHELVAYDAYFDYIQGVKLDQQQRVAIITNEDNNLIVAGAGSGKTTTLMGKVHYVIDRYQATPQSILLISFTDKSATTIAQRINIPGVEAKTFHKFGLDVISEVEGSKPSIFDVNQFKHLLSKFLKEEMSKPKYAGLVTKYFLEYLKIPKSQEDFKTQGEYLQYLKDQNFSTYKMVESNKNGQVTYRKEVVKSIEECKIANFLFFNNVSYEYERKYERQTATIDHSQYKPDFTITQGEHRIYLEHFALNRRNEVPSFFANRDDKTHADATREYVAGIEWKREVHAKYGTQLIETYSYEMQEGLLFENLSKRLKDCGINLCPKTPEEIWHVISTNSEDEVKSFIDLVATFITLAKSNNYTIADITQRNKSNLDKFIHERNDIFIQIIKPIFDRYQKELLNRSEIDFNDMINSASEYIRNGRFDKTYSYVIIDEFQDISIGRYSLVKALKDSNPDCKLFCVGDDWQSIYRFTGSDISLYKEFPSYFGFTANTKIETTYRFSHPVIATSSEFILRNSNQSHKVLKSARSSKQTNHKIIYSVSEDQDDSQALQQVFDELFEIDRDIDKKEVLILGRYTFDLSSRIKNGQGCFVIDNSEGTVKYSRVDAVGKAKFISAKYLTVHKAKGLEADYVIVINCNSGKFGIPSEKSDDPILNLLLSEADQFENGEERRLFYVAMTRAKDRVYFVADNYNPSKFITELEGNQVTGSVRKCPKCKSANLSFRQGVSERGRYWAFWGCSNFKYGCTFQEWVS